MSKILAVDDSKSMRQMVSMSLKSAGHDVAEAEDGRSRLRANEFGPLGRSIGPEGADDDVGARTGLAGRRRQRRLVADPGDYEPPVGVHRHTATKYIYKLIGEGKIRIRNISTAKVCYLKK